MVTDDNALAHAQANWRIYEERWLMRQEDLASKRLSAMANREALQRTVDCM